MNIRKYITIAAAILFVSIAGCDKEKLPSMSATVDGTEWNATVATILGASYQDYTSILGVSVNGEKIVLAIKGTSPGTYTLNPLEAGIDQVSFYLKDKDNPDDGTKKYVSSNGEVTISSVEDGRISGTFRFTGVNSTDDVIEIANGTFNNVVYL
jgi:hypothetical protein